MRISRCKSPVFGQSGPNREGRASEAISQPLSGFKEA